MVFRKRFFAKYFSKYFFAAKVQIPEVLCEILTQALCYYFQFSKAFFAC
jgi:hypothetical protein